MKTIKGYVIIKGKEYRDERAAEYKIGTMHGKENSEDRIESLEKGLKKKEKEIESVKERLSDLDESSNNKINKLNDIIDVYEEERDEAREVVKAQIENADTEASLEAVKEAQDRREAALKDRAARLEEAEAGEYKKGYADGVADGVRKISEITQKDRDGAMKIAMVAAASHSTPEVIKELANGTKALTEGTTDSED